MGAAGGGRERTPVAEELFRFTDRLYRAGTLSDVNEAALDAITRALGCGRASILLFDGTGISTRLIYDSDVETLYEKILDAAVSIMSSDFAIMQMYHPERGELRLLGYRGFTPTAAAFWEWVGPGSGSICGAALATGARSIVPDIELFDLIAGEHDA